MTKTILVVEDSEVIRELLIQLLEEHYEVVTAVNGQDGIDQALRHKPDLILMDLSLPVLDGWSAVSQIKAMPSLASVPVIAVSAHAMRGEEESARNAGCDDYLTKPIRERVLFDKLARFLGSPERDA
jgi:two-component system cell cycle response regulator DivK